MADGSAGSGERARRPTCRRRRSSSRALTARHARAVLRSRPGAGRGPASPAHQPAGQRSPSAVGSIPARLSSSNAKLLAHDIDDVSVSSASGRSNRAKRVSVLVTVPAPAVRYAAAAAVAILRWR